MTLSTSAQSEADLRELVRNDAIKDGTRLIFTSESTANVPLIVTVTDLVNFYLF